jgi:hypothetical protein
VSPSFYSILESYASKKETVNNQTDEQKASEKEKQNKEDQTNKRTITCKYFYMYLEVCVSVLYIFMRIVNSFSEQFNICTNIN